MNHYLDVTDPHLLIEDAHWAVQELDQQGIYTYYINLDTWVDKDVTDIFGKQYTVIDHVNKLPEELPLLFAALTSWLFTTGFTGYTELIF